MNYRRIFRALLGWLALIGYCLFPREAPALTWCMIGDSNTVLIRKDLGPSVPDDFMERYPDETVHVWAQFWLRTAQLAPGSFLYDVAPWEECDRVVILLGSDDALPLSNVTQAETRDNIERTTAGLLGEGVPRIVWVIPPFNRDPATHAHLLATRDVIEEQCALHGRVYCGPDLWQLIDFEHLHDDVHLNAAGQKIYREALDLPRGPFMVPEPSTLVMGAIVLVVVAKLRRTGRGG